MVVRDKVVLPLIWLFDCLPDSAWAAANWAEIADQLGSTVELQQYSQQNIVSDHHSHPVLTRKIDFKYNKYIEKVSMNRICNLPGLRCPSGATCAR